MTGNTSEESAEDDPTALTDFKFVGPVTAEVMDEAGYDAADIRDKRVSYRMLVTAGANAGVATKLRREHSLPWSITGEGNEDLGRRSDQVRGLSDEERAWVAASSGDWSAGRPSSGSADESAEADGSGESTAAEAAWRERSKPEPVTEIDGIGPVTKQKLANAGITSVRSLATIDPENVADLLDLDEEKVAGWRDAANDRV